MSQDSSHNIAEAARQLRAQTALWQRTATAAGMATTPSEAQVPLPPLTTGDVYVIVPPPAPDQRRECPLPGAPSFAPATPGAGRGGGWAPQISTPGGDIGVAPPSPSPLLHVPSPPLALATQQCPQGGGALSPCAWAWIFFFVVLAVFVVLGIFYFAVQSRRHRR
jgi:hypothetical protein